MKQLTLDRLRVGQSAIVRGVNGQSQLSRQLQEMGLVAGTVVQVVRFAPWGDPMQILVRGYHLSLRLADAKEVLVELVS